AVAAAEKALVRSPDDPAVTAALQQAREKLKEKESHELLQQRVGEIRAKINKGQHTDAVDLARQTIATLGPDDQATHLLRLAEMELAQKREKQEEQEKQLLAVQTVVQEGRFADATKVLKDAFETQVLSRKDPRVQELLKKIKIGKATSAPPTSVDIPAPPQTLEKPVAAAPSIEQEPSPDASVEQTFAEPTYAVAGEAHGETFSATIVSGASVQPQADLTTEPSSMSVRSGAEDDSLFALDYAEPHETPAVLLPLLQRIVQTIQSRPLPFDSGFLALVVAVVIFSFYISHRPSNEDFDLRAKAQKFEEQKDWPAALAGFETLARTPRGLANFGRENAARLRKLLDQENSLWASAGNSESKGDTLGAKKIYQEVKNLNGDKGSLALAAVARLSRIIDPPPPAKKPDTHSTHGKAGSSGKTETASKRSEKNASESCQLIPSDVIRHLERADRYRGSGLY